MKRVMRVLVAFRDELDHDQLKEDDMEALRDINAAYEKWERRVKAEGKTEGKTEGSRETLIKAIQTFCQRCEIDLTEERRAQLASCEPDELESLLVEIGLSHKWPSG